ncbi:MAG: hypothetical protein ACTHU0_03000 [Kofleriaceae bacterium]
MKNGSLQMSRWEWGVLVRGTPDELGRQVRFLFEAIDIEPHFAIRPGERDWQLVHGTGRGGAGTEGPLAEALVAARSETVYALALGDDEPYVLAIHADGSTEAMEQTPDELARSLGCALPDESRSQLVALPPSEQRSIALLEGMRAEAAREAYRSAFGTIPPPDLLFEEVPGGVLLLGPACDQGFADLSISECLPEVTVYRVTTSATLVPFLVQVIRGGEPVGTFTRPPRNSDLAPNLETVKDLRDPSAILAALGILAAMFSD